ncbi:MAG: hypothetical protein H6742_11675 [Alphaproteobacteria bacterium]|nr:hypothetical protein [Alphaproteobacteria bacterium]
MSSVPTLASLCAAPPSPARDGALAALVATADHAESVQVADWVRLQLKPGPRSPDDWHETLGLTAYRLDGHGMPTLERDGDPFHGEEVTRILLLAPRVDEPAWTEAARALGCGVAPIGLGRGVELLDAIGGTGHRRMLVEGPSTAPGQWWLLTWMLD